MKCYYSTLALNLVIFFYQLSEQKSSQIELSKWFDSLSGSSKYDFDISDLTESDGRKPTKQTIWTLLLNLSNLGSTESNWVRMEELKVIKSLF